jgi:hypothetical protein
MMVATGVPFEEFRGIRVGDFIFEDEIIHLYKAPKNAPSGCVNMGT